MPPIIKSSAFCEHFAINGRGKILLYKEFRELLFASFPSTTKRFFWIVGAAIEDNIQERLFGMKIVTPRGRTLHEMEERSGPEVQNPNWDGSTHASFFELRLLFPEAGEYRFEFFIDGQSVHIVYLPVKLTG